MKEQINDLVRVRIRRIRKRKQLNLAETARRAGMPVSSYAALEYGDNRLRLDTLQQIIRALDVDILSLWPYSAAQRETEGLEGWRNEFRLGELVSLSASSGASLFWIAPPDSRPLLTWNLRETMLQRLIFWLEERPANRVGGVEVVEQSFPDGRLSLLLDRPTRLKEARPLIKHYMHLWAGCVGSDKRRDFYEILLAAR